MVEPDLGYLVGALRDGSVFYDRAARNYNVVWYSKYKEYLEQSIEPRVQRVFLKQGRLENYKPGQWRYKLSGLAHYKLVKDQFGFPTSPNDQSTWDAPISIGAASQETKIAHIRGVYDAEGHVSIPNRYVEVSQKNTNLLLSVKDELARLGIKTGRVCVVDRASMTYQIVIASKRGLASFARLIGFEHPRKRVQLETLIKMLEDSS